MRQAYSGRDVYIVDGSRTPFLKARGKPGPFSAADLAVATCQPLMLRQNFTPDAFDEVITGAAMPSEDEANVSRVFALRLGCGKSVPAFTVMRNCGSGMQAIDNGAQNISSGISDLVLAGGVDAMSRAPLVYNDKVVHWFSKLNQARTFSQKAVVMAKINPKAFLSPIIALLQGLRDPIVGLSMGQTAEKLAYQFQITRHEMDSFALQSHQRLAKAQDEHLLWEVTPIFDYHGHIYEQDDGIRRDTTLEKLGQLKPFFDKKYGQVTAGNSSQVTDGAAFVILASKDAIKKYKLPVLGKILDCQWAGLDPAVMGLGPVFSSTPILQRHDFNLKDIDYWEINEAFAAQVLACLRAWNDKAFCQEHFGMKEAVGNIDQDKLNIFGGAICMGHPIGASGARLVIQLLNVLHHKNARRGMATLCIGGGQGGAMLIEACNKITDK